jgi:hypothetical protein
LVSIIKEDLLLDRSGFIKDRPQTITD